MKRERKKREREKERHTESKILLVSNGRETRRKRRGGKSAKPEQAALSHIL